jgi:hypothetical protein
MGIPKVLESDNGPQYRLYELKQFCESWKSVNRTSSPYFPRCNALAERYIETAKDLLKKCAEDGCNVNLALRNTPLNRITKPKNFEQSNEKIHLQSYSGES